MTIEFYDLGDPEVGLRCYGADTVVESSHAHFDGTVRISHDELLSGEIVIYEHWVTCDQFWIPREQVRLIWRNKK